ALRHRLVMRAQKARSAVFAPLPARICAASRLNPTCGVKPGNDDVHRSSAVQIQYFIPQRADWMWAFGSPMHRRFGEIRRARLNCSQFQWLAHKAGERRMDILYAKALIGAGFRSRAAQSVRQAGAPERENCSQFQALAHKPRAAKNNILWPK